MTDQTATFKLLFQAFKAQETAAQVAKVQGSVTNLAKSSGSVGSSFSAALSKVTSGAGKVSGALGHAFGQVKNLVTGPLGFLGITGGLLTVGGAFSAGLTKAQDWGLQIEKLQGITRDSAEQLSGLLAVTEKFGLSNERLAQIAGFSEKALGNLTKGVTDTGLAIAGTSKKVSGSQKFLEDYGFSILDAKGQVKDFSSLLLTFSDYWNGNTAQGLKAAAAAKLFGRGYADLVPILNLGSKGIQAAEEEAKALGLTLTQDNVVALAKAREATRKWGDALGGLQLQLGLALLPQLTKLASWATTFVSQNRDGIVNFFKNAASAAEHFASMVGTLVGKASAFWNSLPPELRGLLVKGFIADKTVKFLFGFDPAGKAFSGISSAISQAVASGMAKGATTAGISKFLVQHVWVDNPGFGGPGNSLLPAAEGAAGAEVAAGMSVAEIATTAGAALAIGAVVTAAGILAANVAHNLAPGTFVDPQAARNIPLRGVGGPARPGSAIGPSPDRPGFSNPIGRNPDKAGIDTSDDTRETRAIASYNRIVIPSNAPVVAGLSKIQLAIRSFGYSPSQWAAIYARAMKAEGRSLINTLAKSHDKLNSIAMADSETSKFLTGVAGPFYRDGKNQTRLLASLQKDQAYFRAHGDTATAAKLGHDIDLLKAKIKPPVVNVNVTMNTSVTVADIQKKTKRQNSYGFTNRVD